MSPKLLEFNYNVEYVPGKKNLIADYLSRAPLPLQENNYAEWNDLNIAIVHDHSNAASDAISNGEWNEEYRNDNILNDLATYVVKGWPSKSNLQSELRTYWEVKDELWMNVCSYLCRGERIIVPSNLRQRILSINHEGHLGIIKLRSRVKSLYWWPGLDRDVERFVQKCTICANADKTQRVFKPSLGLRHIPEQPWEDLSVDWLGPIEDECGDMKHILVVIDNFSKWPEIEITNKCDSKEVVRFLEKLFLREGIPRNILSDNGPQFSSDNFLQFLNRNGINAMKTPVYHPSGNGIVERFNRVIMGSIQAAINAGMKWEKELLSTVWAYRITPTCTSYSPFRILRGREPFTKDNVTWNRKRVCGRWSPAVVRSRLRKIHESYIDKFGKKHHTEDVNLRIGDWVRIKLGTKVKKGGSKFSPPLQVIETYSKSAKLSDNKIWHHSRMARCRGNCTELCSKNISSSPMDWLWDDVIDKENVTSSSHDDCNNVPTPSHVDVEEPSGSGVRVTRAGRSVRAPVKYKNFVM